VLKQFLHCLGAYVFNAVSYVSDRVWHVSAIAKLSTLGHGQDCPVKHFVGIPPKAIPHEWVKRAVITAFKNPRLDLSDGYRAWQIENELHELDRLSRAPKKNALR
jgi:hypothetical protein